ncbi:hypothetical protein DMB45_01095 [Sanguibacteroides justesenii]|uniref:NodB homology domain-containing protein n=2 Tax=Sanguibacteroides justesenii TaxID=1547597 RepID=A0A0C3RIM7_9PORP|nr:hypothetical protein BA92_05195 [Sanguibacteroides justesenii]PXZ45067.1 hypothetical protein DMB45_01095 [Sanguibacteroides justesenii]
METVMDTYKEKMAHLISLIVRIKRYSFEELEIMLEISQVQKILNMPEVKNRDWENESFENREVFITFLDTYIDIYQRALETLKKKSGMDI